MKETELSSYNNSWYRKSSFVKRTIWYFLNAFILDSYLFPLSSVKRMMLRLFGAKIGRSVVIKPSVSIKYPWNLTIGDYTWIGERVWIDNLGEVQIGKNVCISQGAMLLSGNHDYSKTTFDLWIGKIVLEDGVWIGAKSVVTAGVTCRSHSVLAVGSVASKELEPYSVYAGIPAVKVRDRVIE